ncbi:GrpB family protein [Vagococcus teuberi]|uniref:Dephospho-CoA kinase n=1 Tax=Vagococcus teuberi TaxID=519472 RepID=A0A1J0A572_9ENTE|nr:GrpB family protein [Vagococcus teuberi]APB31093.1 dephospho-CoA kinase [Vagococcus teuberi]
MKLGLKNNEVVIVPYNQEWEIEFNGVRQEILKNINLNCNCIEHVGSTAIKGIKAKPIIDILIGVDDISKLDDSFFNQLKKLGFYRLRIQKHDEIVCAKFIDNTFEIKTHIIHLVNFNQKKWNDLILFRDILRTHDNIKKQYENIKQTFLENNLNEITAYTDYKENFVKDTLKNYRE